eukprot:GGOE01042996.1.p1 GENE.GGOE01042996.1~~GGOE01042996.1.p1  ORF type:complete len:300 (-),score=65.50 GGOE01042996.1:248-1099(-)
MKDPDPMEEELVTIDHDLAPAQQPPPEAALELDDEMLLEPAVSSAPTLLGDLVPGPIPQARAAVSGSPPKEFDLSSPDSSAETSEEAAGGWKAMVSRAREAAVSAVKHAERVVRTGIHHQAEETFRTHFPLLAAERVLAMYPCRARHGALVPSIEGTLTITDHTLCFAGLAGLNLTLPLQEIASLQPAVMLATQLGHPPYFLPTPNGDVLPDAVQVFTCHGTRYSFHSFSALLPLVESHQTPLQRAVSYLDHAWRAVTPVPVPGVDYATEGAHLSYGCESDTV